MTAQTILPANSVTGGFDVDNSLRFNSASSDYLNRTPNSASNRKTFTISFWTKICKFDTTGYTIIGAGDSSSGEDGELVLKIDNFGSDGQLILQTGPTVIFETTQVLRDVSAWYHIVVSVDTTNGTSGNRVRLYINGSEVSDFDVENQPSQNQDFAMNSNVVHEIGRFPRVSDQEFDGYLAEFVFIDGQQLAPDQFGEFDDDSGIWKPIDVSDLTFGTNGFYLEFKQSGTSANASGLGADTGGNDHHFTVNNLTAVDQSTDTCTNNFATLNPLQPPVHAASNAMVLREGNLQLHGSTDGGPKFEGASTIGVSSGKWYAEFKSTISNNVFGMVGVDSNPGELARNDKYPGFYANSYGYFKDGEKYTGNSGSSYGDAWTNDTIGVALDLDNNKLYFSKNGTFQNSGDPTTGATGTGAISITAASSTTAGAYFFVLGDTSTSYINPFDCNFGSPMHSISSGNADGNGFGNFEYAVPSGYFALNTKNLAEHG